MRNLYHLFLAWLGSLIYGHPSKKLIVVGITGTKGKSSVLEILNAILEGAGKKTALLSSVKVKIAGVSEKNQTDTTMPGRFFIQKFLRQAVEAGCEIALLEVTSQGVLQHRHKFIDFNVAGFLNLHPEHIEAHGSFEKYRDAKVEFFRTATRTHSKKNKTFVINHDDASAPFFEKAIVGAGTTINFTKAGFIQNILKGDTSLLSAWFQNDFNMEDGAMAAALAGALRINQNDILKGLTYFTGLPGRMEWLQTEPFGALVDYAHTPGSLEAVYKSLSEKTATSHKLICVLGSAGGGRDKWKRSEFGKIAATYCDEIILTDEDPYNEPPEEIINQIEAGISLAINKKAASVQKILDRKMAIGKAISSALPGDIVVITGKGSEEFIHVAHGKKLPWSDKATVQEALTNKKKDTNL